MRLLTLTLAGTVLALATPAAHAQAPLGVIDGSPLNVYADGQGALQIRFDGQTDGVFYPPGDNPANAGLELVANGTTYSLGSGTTTSGPTLGTAGGAQTLTSEYTIAAAFHVIETISYANASQNVLVHYVIQNLAATAVDIRAGELADLYVSGDDSGAGVFAAGPPRFVGGQSPTGTVSGLSEITPWNNFQAGPYGSVFSNFEFGGGLDGTVDGTETDNGAGVQWVFPGVAPQATRVIDTRWQLGTPQTPTPTPTPVPTATPAPVPTAAPVPPPVAGKSVNVEVEGGKVRIKLPGSNRYFDLGPEQQIPLGATIDTTKGRVGITAAADKGSATMGADLYDGIFKVTQTKGAKPFTELTLNGPKPVCGTAKGASAAAKKPKSRKLWGDGSGSFRTRGQFSSATVRGTHWLTQDTCSGTLTQVVRGVVSVQDLVKHKTVLVKAGHQYLARPRKH